MRILDPCCQESNYFLFFLNPELSYRIIIHDPSFYHIVERGEIFPRIWLEYKASRDMQAGHYEGYFLSVTEHHLLNRPEQPCEEAEDYDFLQCLKTNQAEIVGCRPPWDSWSPHTIPLCQTMEQLQHYERLDMTYLHQELPLMINSSGCQVPCKHKVGLTTTHQLSKFQYHKFTTPWSQTSAY